MSDDRTSGRLERLDLAIKKAQLAKRKAKTKAETKRLEGRIADLKDERELLTAESEQE